MNISMMIKGLLPTRYRSKEYRDAVVDATIGNTISSQIFSMRKKRGWNQGQLADKCGMKQARISVMESPSYKSFSITTLKRLASAFDVALVVRFVPFSDLAAWVDDLSAERLTVPSFDEEAAAAPQAIYRQPPEVVTRWASTRPMPGHELGLRSDQPARSLDYFPPQPTQQGQCDPRTSYLQ